MMNRVTHEFGGFCRRLVASLHHLTTNNKQRAAPYLSDFIVNEGVLSDKIIQYRSRVPLPHE